MTVLTTIALHARRNAVAYVALFVALGGTSYAAVNLPKNSVGTKQLKNNAVTSTKVRDGSLTGADVNESALGDVPRARDAAHALNADNAAHALNADNAAHALNADNAAHALNADNAAHALNADKLGGVPPSAFLKQADAIPPGGSLTGTYASPTIAPGSVGTGKIGVQSVNAQRLGNITIRTAQVTVRAAGGIEGNGSYATAGATASCDTFETALTGAAYWDTEDSSKELTISQTKLIEDTYQLNSTMVTRPHQFRAIGGNDTSADHVLTVQVACLTEQDVG